MKKFILIPAVIFLISSESKAQQEKQTIALTSYTLSAGKTVIKDNLTFSFSNDPGNDVPVKDYAYYLKKKKSNLTAGLVTLGAGLLFSGIGLITATNSNSFDDDATAGVLFIAGAASGIASIPLMIMAHVYGHKAKLELSTQKTGFGVPANVSKDIVGITVAISIGK
ncbi:MAG: hypothetical protein ABIN74_04905 [Ferruginibacter sp.]